jgi:hypothetical protein
MRSMKLEVVAAVLVIVGVLVIGSAVSAAGATPSGVKSKCIRAGLVKPRHFAAALWLQILGHETKPEGYVTLELDAMPEECAGQYNRLIQVHVRYKTSLRGWKTLRGFGTHGGGPTTWEPVWTRNAETGAIVGPGLSNIEIAEGSWGRLQKVEAKAKLVVASAAKNEVVGQCDQVRTMRGR